MTNIAEWEKDFNKKYPQLFDGAGEYEGYTCDMTDDVKGFIRTLLAKQREELLGLVEKEVVGEDEEWGCYGDYGDCVEMEEDVSLKSQRNQFRAELRQKLSALRLPVKDKK